VLRLESGSCSRMALNIGHIGTGKKRRAAKDVDFVPMADGARSVGNIQV